MACGPGGVERRPKSAQGHARQLEGPDAPALVGQDVMQNWATAGGLFDYIHVAMPPSIPVVPSMSLPVATGCPSPFTSY